MLPFLCCGTRRFSVSLTPKVAVTCAVTGAGDTAWPGSKDSVPKGKSPEVPYTPLQIAESALKAHKAGAAIVHLHVRDPTTGKAGRDLEKYNEVVKHIRASGEDVLINLTCGMGGDYLPDPQDPSKVLPGTDLLNARDRIAHALELKPDICTFDCGTMNYTGQCYIAPDYMLREMAEMLSKSSVKIEIECFELGHIWFAKQLLKEGKLKKEQILFQLCMGIPWAAEAYPENLLAMRDRLPANTPFSCFGISRHQFPIAAQSVLAGGHVRVGLEDNLYLEKGVYATNEGLVEKACSLVKNLGSEIASVAETRKIFQL